MRQISIAIPTYNRIEMPIKAFSKVIDDKRVSEVVLVDDASTDEVYKELSRLCDAFPKVKLCQNTFNLDCYANKAEALAECSNQWCILLDSDNVIDEEYIDRIFSLEWENDTIYAPSFAKTHFDFRNYSGLTITKENVSQYIDLPMFEVMCNAANYFVNRNEYLKVWDKNTNPVTSDSIYQVYNWLKSGRQVYVVPGLEYIHSVHNGSHYQNNVNRTPQGFHESILNNLRQMV